MAPKGTPKPIIAKLSAEIAKGLHLPKTRQQLALQGAEPGGNTPADFAVFLKEENDRWSAVAKAAKIVPE
jgi:tripartite-type tricarboxylate transporter receptor subunit TctC